LIAIRLQQACAAIFASFYVTLSQREKIEACVPRRKYLHRRTWTYSYVSVPMWCQLRAHIVLSCLTYYTVLNLCSRWIDVRLPLSHNLITWRNFYNFTVTLFKLVFHRQLSGYEIL